jgi:hypothetical protein
MGYTSEGEGKLRGPGRGTSFLPAEAAAPKRKESGGAMRIIAFDKFRPGVTMEKITPYLAQEVSNVWRLWKAGVVRENYARADEPGVVIIFEVPDVATARRYTDDFPLSRAGLLEWSFIALQVPLPIETLFRDNVDLNQPYDRTLGQV